VDILSDTITGGQNNSVLLVGARGAGKTLVLDSALRQLRETHGTGVLPVRLNGMLHSDERVGMRVSFYLYFRMRN
jgi:origin recognition complex subunit 4